MDGYRIDDPARAGDVLRQALSSGRPALVEAVVDPHETPFADTVKPGQAQSIITAYDAGERDRAAMARNMARPDVRAMSPGIDSISDDLHRFD